jgi:hypothetical protein
MPDEIQNPQGQVPADTAAQNPFDTSAEQGELDALTAELEQARASIEGDFAKFAAANTTPELEEQFFEDKEAFYKAILEMQNAYLAENITPKAQRAAALQGDIAQKQQFGAIDAAVKGFQQAHPEVDVNQLMEWFLANVPPQVQQEIQALPPEQMFEEIYNLFTMQGQGGEQGQEGGGEENLPQQIQGVPSNAEQLGGSRGGSYVTRL